MCIFVTICFLLFFWLIPISLYADNEIHLTLIPPAIVTNQVDLDIRGAVKSKCILFHCIGIKKMMNI